MRGLALIVSSTSRAAPACTATSPIAGAGVAVRRGRGRAGRQRTHTTVSARAGTAHLQQIAKPPRTAARRRGTPATIARLGAARRADRHAARRVDQRALVLQLAHRRQLGEVGARPCGARAAAAAARCRSASTRQAAAAGSGASGGARSSSGCVRRSSRNALATSCPSCAESTTCEVSDLIAQQRIAELGGGRVAIARIERQRAIADRREQRAARSARPGGSRGAGSNARRRTASERSWSSIRRRARRAPPTASRRPRRCRRGDRSRRRCELLGRAVRELADEQRCVLSAAS